jgi:hypothetical protein
MDHAVEEVPASILQLGLAEINEAPRLIDGEMKRPRRRDDVAHGQADVFSV